MVILQSFSITISRLIFQGEESALEPSDAESGKLGFAGIISKQDYQVPEKKQTIEVGISLTAGSAQLECYPHFPPVTFAFKNRDVINRKVFRKV